jgi:hypothetical protein
MIHLVALWHICDRIVVVMFTNVALSTLLVRPPGRITVGKLLIMDGLMIGDPELKQRVLGSVSTSRIAQ